MPGDAAPRIRVVSEPATATEAPPAPDASGAAKPSFRISLAWRFFLFFAVLLGLVVGVATMGSRAPGTLLLVAGLALLVAAPAAWFLARATLRPLAAMTQAAQGAAAGEYRSRMDVDSDDEFGELARSFDGLCSDLAERAALGAYAAAAAHPAAPGREHGRSGAPPGEAPASLHPVTHGTPTLLAVDLRRFAEPLDPQLVAPVLASLAEVVRRMVALAHGQRGLLLTAGATRLVFGFEGELRVPRALYGARLMLEEEPHAAAALLEGEAASGAIEFEPGASVSTLFGPASQQIERLLSESPFGTLLLSRGLGDAAKTLLGEARVGVAQGQLSGKPFYSIVAGDLSVLPAPPAPEPSATPTAPATGSAMRIGDRFELLGEVGRGPRGALYKARDPASDTFVHLELGDPVDGGAEQAATPAADAGAPAPLHPNLVRTLASGEHAGRPYRVTEYFPAPTLERALERCGRLPLAAALRLARQVCAGMEALHAAGRSHGDIRAGNILLGANGSVKLAGALEVPGESASAGAGEAQRADIHAFGLVLRDCFDATPVPGATGPAGALASDAAAAAGFNAFIRACLRADSGPQFNTTRELCAALDQIRA